MNHNNLPDEGGRVQKCSEKMGGGGNYDVKGGALDVLCITG